MEESSNLLKEKNNNVKKHEESHKIKKIPHSVLDTNNTLNDVTSTPKRNRITPNKVNFLRNVKLVQGLRSLPVKAKMYIMFLFAVIILSSWFGILKYMKLPIVILLFIGFLFTLNISDSIYQKIKQTKSP